MSLQVILLTPGHVIVPIVFASLCVYLHPVMFHASNVKSTSGKPGSLPVESAVSEVSGCESHGSICVPTAIWNTCHSRIQV